MRNLLRLAIFMTTILAANPAQAYLMQILTYSNLYERADVVVIATAVETADSVVSLKLEVEQPKDVTDLIKTVDTKFKLGVTLKGKLDTPSFRFLHLNRKDGKLVGMFGAVGTFFIDFHAKHNKQKSFLLFMKRRKDGTYCSVWRPMEGSRAIITIKKDSTL